MEKGVFSLSSLDYKITRLYEAGTFIVGIRYYRYKINLYLYDGRYYEVFYNHKYDRIEKIELLDNSHSRMKFYTDQIKLNF
ncbi:MAG: hypothetical protein OEW75_14985 [Cyclobacteriaceae bacterium]|nr:hypothetical protein [Cyclobacteriaceae bacterium]